LVSRHPGIRFARGRVDSAMLAAFLPPPPSPTTGQPQQHWQQPSTAGQPAAATVSDQLQVHYQPEVQQRLRVRRVVVSGPAGMWAAVRASLDAAGHAADVVVELEA
jgi:hypothetical protein